MSDLIPTEGRTAFYAVRATATETRRAYRRAYGAFVGYCEARGLEPLDGDPETVAGYLASIADAGLSLSSVRIAAASVRAAYRLAELPFDSKHPRLVMVLEGIARTLGAAPQRKAAAAVPDVLRRLLAVCEPDSDPLGARDRCMLLLGFGAALRRSEIVALRIGDIGQVDKGLLVTVRRSKTDQQGRGVVVPIWRAELEPDFCASRAFDAWMVHRAGALDLAPPEAPLFVQVGKWRNRPIAGIGLTDKAVARVVKNTATAAGLDPSRFSAHSLRAGMPTVAGENGESLADIMAQTRHKSVDVALGYVRTADKWRNNVTKRVFR